MMKSWLYGVFVSVIFITSCVKANTIDNIAQLNGRDVIWSSPYKSGKEAQRIKVNHINFGEDFFDDGRVVINEKLYPIDQLFIENDGKYENLAHILSYNGVGNTFFIRYYDENRLPVHQELLNLKNMATSCLGDYNKGGVEGIKKEALQYEICLDSIFNQIVDLFYAQSGLKLRQNYDALSTALNGFYSNISQPDYCYGKCGTIAQMRVYNKILERKRDFILDMIDQIDISDE